MELGIAGLSHATEIGAGGSAVVYKALQADLDREVAVKVLSATDDAFVRRFHREAKTLGKLSLNPGIVTVHGTGVTESGHPYLILELCESSVLDHLKTNGRFEPAAACLVGAQVADAVSDAHQNGVVHRDIKPGNLLRSQNGRYLITDFGIATVTGSTLGQTDSIGFTAGYVAPETLRGEEAGTPADVYALGASLFHMLTGYPPFVDQGGNSNLLALAQRVINDPVPDLRPYGIPDDICRIVEGAMAKHPDDRPSAAQLRGQLQAAVGSATPQDQSQAAPAQVQAPKPPLPIPSTAPAPNPTTTTAPTPAPTSGYAAGSADQTAAMDSLAGSSGPAGTAIGATTEAQAGFGQSIAAPPPHHGPTADGGHPQGPTRDRLTAGPGILSGSGSVSAVPPSQTGYPLPPHRDGPEPWKLILLGVAAAAVLLLGAIAIALSRSDNPDGLETTGEEPESPTAEDQESADGSGSNTDGGDGGQSGALPDQESTTTTEAEATVDIPNVLGQSEAAASSSLIDAGLVIKVEERPDGDAPAGTVIAQSPPAGTAVDSGSIATIILAVAEDAVLAEIPTLAGMTEAQAISALTEAGFEVSEPTREFNPLPDGQVISSNPAEGSSADTASPVSLLISRGPEPPRCSDLIGLTETQATARVDGANLTATVTREENGTEPEGQVTGCEPSDGGFALVVSDGPEICGVVTGMSRAAGVAALEAKGFTVTEVGELRPDLPAGEIFNCTKQGTSATVSYATGLPSECPETVKGATVPEARAALGAAGFTDITVERTPNDTVANGRVINCQVSGGAVTITVSTGPDVQTGRLTVRLVGLEVEAPCVGDGARPDLYGTISATYDGVRRNFWANTPAADAETPNASGRLNIGETRSWADVAVDQDITIGWDLSDADQEGRKGDEDGEDDAVSTTTRQITLTGTDRAWQPISDANDACELKLIVEIEWDLGGN